MSAVGGPSQPDDDPSDGSADDVTELTELTDDDTDDAAAWNVLSDDAGPGPRFKVGPPRVYRVGRWRYQKDEHDAVTRRIIAFWVLSIVSVLYLLAVVGMVCHWINVEELGRIALVLGPIQALAAAVLGFYFGRQNST
jgi:hypothetical protein